jgi:glycosyltransferase involved in cell wall biosynthesis
VPPSSPEVARQPAIDSRPVVDLIIPALNEASNIPALFDAIRSAIVNHQSSIGFSLRHMILADNGSTDATPELATARGAVVVHEAHRGYGAACLKAIDWITSEASSGPPDIIVFLDADLSDDPNALPMLIAPFSRESQRPDIVIGSRVRLADPGALNIVQRFGNSLACAMMLALAGRRYSDLGPFRALRWSALNQLNMRDRTWGWTVEMQMKAALIKIPTIEVDVPYRKRRSGRSKISGTVRGMIKAGTKIIMTIASVWWNHRRKR